MTDIDWQLVKISIHALRKESDSTRLPQWPYRPYFNPRSP